MFVKRIKAPKGIEITAGISVKVVEHFKLLGLFYELFVATVCYCFNV
jgi:hypothetical protein